METKGNGAEWTKRDNYTAKTDKLIEKTDIWKNFKHIQNKTKKKA